MQSFRAHGRQPRREPVGAAPGPRVVSRSSPRRPRWRALYVTLMAMFLLGFAARFAVHDRGLVVLDTGLALGLFGVLARGCTPTASR